MRSCPVPVRGGRGRAVYRPARRSPAAIRTASSDETKSSPEALYKKAHKAMESYDFNGAIKGYER